MGTLYVCKHWPTVGKRSTSEKEPLISASLSRRYLMHITTRPRLANKATCVNIISVIRPVERSCGQSFHADTQQSVSVRMFAKQTTRGNRKQIIHLVPCTMHNYWSIRQIQQSWKHGFRPTGKQYALLNPDDGTDRLSRNVGSKKLPLLAA
jgi:hypothetical protein